MVRSSETVQSAGNPAARPKVGLFGGSFNPAHSGHLHVAETALDHLGLDEVWWIVAQGNPFKSDHGDFFGRLASAEAIAHAPQMRVLDIEARLGLTYTRDTLAVIRQDNPNTDFVWLMGGDNLSNFHRWKDWETIVTSVPIAFIARADAELGQSLFEGRFSAARLGENKAHLLAGHRPPAWVYLQAPLNPESSTRIRHTATARKE